jgi:hypothetical protein
MQKHALVHTKNSVGIACDHQCLEIGDLVITPEHGNRHYSIRNRGGEIWAPSVQARHGRGIRRIEKEGLDILSDAGKGKVWQIRIISAPGKTPLLSVVV